MFMSVLAFSADTLLFCLVADKKVSRGRRSCGPIMLKEIEDFKGQ